MFLDKVKQYYAVTKSFVIKNLPTILTGVAIAESIDAFVDGIKSTPEALRRVEIAKDNKLKDKNGNYIVDKENYDNTLNPWEYCKAVAPVYWRPVAKELIAVGSMFGSNRVSVNRYASLLAAYSINDNNFKEYKEKIKETLGEKKTQEFKDKLAKSKVEANPVDESKVIYTGMGDYLCYDTISGRYFTSTIEKVRQAVNNINEKLLTEIEVPLNDFYEELGLPTIDMGDILGWVGMGGSKIIVDYSSQLTKEGKPVMTITYDVAAGYNDVII